MKTWIEYEYPDFDRLLNCIYVGSQEELLEIWRENLENSDLTYEALMDSGFQQKNKYVLEELGEHMITYMQKEK